MANEVKTRFTIEGFEDSIAKIDAYKARLASITDRAPGDTFAGLRRSVSSLADDFTTLERRALTLQNTASRLGDVNRSGGFRVLTEQARLLGQQAANVQQRLAGISTQASRTGDRNILKALNAEADELKQELLIIDRRLRTIRSIDIQQGFRPAAGPGFDGGTFGRDLLGGLGGRVGAGLAAGGAAGAAAAGVLVTVEALKSLAVVTKDLSVQSVRLAADFEQTVNALTVFAGSAGVARSELKALSDTARTTPGLSLEAAEAGYTRLRSIGFEADRARRIVKELAEEATLSGADSEAVERVVFNFAQIASGGQKVGQEIREIITQIPSLNKVFREAFGTISGDALQEIVDRDPAIFFDKLIEAMERGRSVTGGFNDSIQKLTDEFIRAGRTLGEPILQPLTNDVRSLTDLIAQNQNVLVSFGQSIADAYRGASFYIKVLSDIINDIPTPPDWVLRLLDAGGAAGRSRIPVLAAIDQGVVVARSLAARGRQLREANTRPQNASAGLEGGIDGILRLQERERKAVADSIKRTYDEQRSIADNFYRVEEARIAASGRSEIDQIKAIADVRRRSLVQQLADSESYYEKAISTAKDREDLEKFVSESIVNRNKLETELRLNALETEQKLNEERKRQAKDAEREAEKRQKEQEQLRKTAIGLFDDLAGRAGRTNPYIALLQDANRLTRQLTENTEALTARQADFLRAQGAALNTRSLSELQAKSIVEAFGLQAEARDFRRGFRLEGPAATRQLNSDLAEQFGRLRRGDISREVFDQTVINLTRGLDPRDLNVANRFQAAQARENEAARLAEQQRESLNFFRAMNAIVGPAGLRVSIADGQHVVRVIDESARADVSTRPTAQATAARYGNP